MAGFFRSFKFKAIVTAIMVCILAVLYSYFVADTIQTRITDAQMTKVDGRFMIATEYRPFVNEDVWYRFKFDSGLGSERCDPVQGEGREDQEIRMANTHLFPVRECREDRRGEVERALRLLRQHPEAIKFFVIDSNAVHPEAIKKGCNERAENSSVAVLLTALRYLDTLYVMGCRRTLKFAPESSTFSS
jgi:hypothetical protein